MEHQRTLAAIAAEHRQANRDRYIDLLRFATDAVGAYSGWAFFAGVVERLSVPGPIDDTELLNQMVEMRAQANRDLTPYLKGGPSRATIVRATGAGLVADRFESLLSLLTSPGPKFNVPHRATFGLADFSGLRGDARIEALDNRIAELDAALVTLRDAISHALATDGGSPASPVRAAQSHPASA